ncbi:FadR/GntR family transcriptional regulator [Knoellia subterranea]|uniref:GntR family transcriptional regulator n=1 Tax=Knoellia subterranea KCTC 19937 TaxID=1385521 RepID=A0A0A0JLP7_9MICO|nr:FadR/GntR family transcriptional regulator [Knoellia subterranea]KGN38018.1 GntR family transcriptional regulator [Knoellia subterranea KCTC 19937]
MAKFDAGPPITRPALRRDEVVSGIKDYIVRNQLRPGDPLPTEAELCEAVGASRSSVREAVKTLSALDIVDVRHGHGTYVGRMSLNALVESLAFRGLLTSEDDHLVLGQVVEIRQTIEQGLAPQVADGLDDEQLATLRRLADGMAEAAERGEDYLELDRQFHLLLMEPLHNDLIQQLTGAFWEVQSIVTPTLGAAHKEALTLTASLHLAIVEAAEAHDIAALRNAVAAHYAPIRELIASAKSVKA